MDPSFLAMTFTLISPHTAQARKLDVYFELEEKLMSKQSLDKSLMDVITDPDAGSPEDKMRLFVIFFICTPTMSDVSGFIILGLE